MNMLVHPSFSSGLNKCITQAFNPQEKMNNIDKLIYYKSMLASLATSYFERGRGLRTTSHSTWSFVRLYK